MTTGCSLGVSVDNLLTPPKLSKEQYEIHEALINAVGKDINLIYPKSGDYRSAIIIENIDDDSEPEALVFYEIAGDAEAETDIRVNILDTINGKWQSVYDHAGVGTAVEKVIFSSLGDSGDVNILIGYSTLSNEKSLRIYSFINGLLQTDYIDTYGSMFISDMNRDGFNELFVINPNKQDNQAHAGLISKANGVVFEYTSVLLNPKTTDFVNIASGFIGRDTPALFIDGISGGQLSTEILYTINGQLRNPVYISESGILKNTERPVGYLCTDIDFDGIIEIPTLTLFPGYNTESTEPLYITNWNVLENYSIVKKYSSYYNVSYGYCFMIPSRWENLITTKTDKASGEIVFYKFQTDLSGSGAELMRFAVANEDESDAKVKAGYDIIKTNDNVVYLVKTPKNYDEPLILTNTEITNNFYLMK